MQILEIIETNTDRYEETIYEQIIDVYITISCSWLNKYLITKENQD